MPAKLFLIGVVLVYSGLFLASSAVRLLLLRVNILNEVMFSRDALDPTASWIAAASQLVVITALSAFVSWIWLARGRVIRGWKVGWMVNPVSAICGWLMYFAFLPLSPPPEYLSPVSTAMLVPGAMCIWFVNAIVVRKAATSRT